MILQKYNEQSNQNQLHLNENVISSSNNPQSLSQGIKKKENLKLNEILDKARWFNLHKHSKKDKKSDDNIQCNGNIPSKRWGHTAVNYNEKMIVFGGRGSKANSTSIHSFDPSTLAFKKLEDEDSTKPFARDSHTCVVFNDEMYIFGGNWQETKLNDLWKFNFERKKWVEISCENSPSAVEGHISSLVCGKFMMIQGGIDKNNKVISNMFLFDLVLYQWYSCLIPKEFEKAAARECRSCVVQGDNCFLFGGSDDDSKIYNDMYKVSISFSSGNNCFHSKWVLEEPITKKPQKRSSHSSVLYDNYIIIIGGEGETPSKFLK